MPGPTWRFGPAIAILQLESGRTSPAPNLGGGTGITAATMMRGHDGAVSARERSGEASEACNSSINRLAYLAAQSPR